MNGNIRLPFTCLTKLDVYNIHITTDKYKKNMRKNNPLNNTNQ